MRLKLDENLGGSAAGILRASGHDVETAREEGLQGRSDEVIYFASRTDDRCLVTLDQGFLDRLRYPPEPAAGIVVLRPRRSLSLDLLLALVRDLAAALAERAVQGRLWIVEPGRIRVVERRGNGTAAP